MHCVQAGTAECRQDRKGVCCHTVYDMRWSAMTWMSTLDSDMGLRSWLCARTLSVVTTHIAM